MYTLKIRIGYPPTSDKRRRMSTGLYNFLPSQGLSKGIPVLEVHGKGMNVFLMNKQDQQDASNASLACGIRCPIPSPTHSSLIEGPKTCHPKAPSHSIQIIAATVAPITQYPEFSSNILLVAPPVLVLESLLVVPLSVPLSSVPFGNVPLMTIVFVPFTSPTCTKLLF